MITKISASNTSYNSNPKSNPSFNGLTNRMSKKIYNGFYSMEALFPRDNMQNPIAGKLPGFMFNKVKEKSTNLKESIFEIYDTFAQVSNELRDFEPTAMSSMKELEYKRSDSTVKKLENVLLKYNIVKPWDEFNIRYIDKGGKGSVYKLEGLKDYSGTREDEFVMKVFHTKSVQTNAYHGCFPEINTASYWMKHLGFETNRGKFFWADVKEAYMINKYIDEDVRLAKKVPDPYSYGVKFTDENAQIVHNVCKGYSYDWGGGVVINQSVNSNRFARKVMQHIQKQPQKLVEQEWNKNYCIKGGGNEDNKFAGLALAIKYLPMKDRTKCFDMCFKKRGKYTDRALGYTLKYLPYEDAVKNYKTLASSTKDDILKHILANEIPFLAVKDNAQHLIKDDRIVLDNISKTNIHEYIDQKKLETYKKIAKEYYVI